MSRAVVAPLFVALLGAFLPSAAAQSAAMCPQALLVDCALCVKAWSLVVNVTEAVYDWGRVKSKCSAHMSEYIAYDLSPAKASRSSQSRTFPLDFVDDFKFLGITSSEAVITDYAVNINPGRTDANGNKQNSSVTIQWLFTLKPGASTSSVTFMLAYDVHGLVKTDATAGYYIEWWPFADNFLLKNTFIKNLTMSVRLPWGATEVGQRYNISTNLASRNNWSATGVLIQIITACYNADFDGHFKLETHFLAPGIGCNELPGWVIVIIVFGCILGILVGCSLLAFIFFEKPYKCLESTEEGGRVKYVDQDLEIVKRGKTLPRRNPSSDGRIPSSRGLSVEI